MYGGSWRGLYKQEGAGHRHQLNQHKGPIQGL
jgi:hypothetical protein